MRNIILAFVLIAAATASPTFARAEDVTDCNQGSDSELRIKGCTRLLKRKGLTPEERSIVLRNRAIGFHQKAEQALENWIPGEGDYKPERKAAFEAALRDRDAAVAVDPKSADARHDRAWNHRYHGRYNRAIADYTEAIRLDPRYVTAYDGRGFTYLLYLGKPDLAILDFSKVIHLDPKNATAYHNRASAYEIKGLHNKAIADFSQAIRLEPRSDINYEGRAEAYAKIGNYKKAIADYSEVIKRNDGQSRYSKAETFMARSKLYSLIGQETKAAADAAEATRLDPSVGDGRVQ